MSIDVLLRAGFSFIPAIMGKLRLLYECAPLAFMMEHAGGRRGRLSLLKIASDP
jgi:fructose-1,6-bisphosphatase